MAHQMNPGALSLEPRLTFNWTLAQFEMNPGALFSKLKKPKKSMFKKPKQKLEKPSILKYIY